MTYVGKKPASIIATAVDTTTGTFSGDLTVDTSTLYVDSANNRVGVGTVSPSQSLHVKGNIDVEGDTSGVSKIRFKAEETHGEVEGINIGTNFGGLAFKTNSNGTVAERMRIDSSGNVGIGTSSPTDTAGFGKALDVSSSTGGAVYVRDAGGSKIGHFGQFNEQTSIVSRQDDGNIAFYTGASPSERMRIDSSGNLLVGKTSSGIATAGIELRSNDDVLITSNGSQALYLNRLSSDGSIVEFRQAGTTVGSITSNGGAIIIGSSDVGVYFDSGSDRIIPVNVSTNSVRNDAIDIGGNPHRFKDLYLSGGVYLGGTGSANKLSDYETGTWSPTVTGAATAGTATFSGTQDGFYVKVGSLVTVSFSYTTTAHTGTGKIRIGGLPFASTSSSGYQAVGTFMANNYDFSDSSPINGNLYLQREVSYLRIYLTRDNTGWIEQDLNAAHGLIASITYRTDS